MSRKTSTSKVNGLLATIQRTAPRPAVLDALTVEPVNARNSRTTRRVGQPIQFWLHQEDRQLVRELAAWLAGQGVRPTDSMVIRAALRTAKTGAGFLDAYREAAQLDGRLKQHRQPRDR
jgi:hypothetical protein